MDELQKIIKYYKPNEDGLDFRIVEKGIYQYFDYYICCFAGHALAYVRINEEYVNDDLISVISTHGGITFKGSLDKLPKVENTTFIGWDYAHVWDYTMFNKDGHLWSIKEIEKHCKEVIWQLIRIYAGKI